MADLNKHQIQNPIVTVENLSFFYDEDKDNPILKNLSFSLAQGSLTAVIGLSGCGKTTLCHCLCGIIPNAVNGKLSGNILLNGENIAGKSLSVLSQTIGLVMQNPDDQIVCTTVEDEIAFALENQMMPPAEIRRRVDEILEFLNITNLQTANPAKLSGGQKQLVAIGSVLALSPQIIIFDEPMSHLDEKGRIMVRATLESLKAAGKTIIVVEHNFSLIDFADLWLVMDKGSLAALDTPQNILAEKNLLSSLHLDF